MRRFRIFQHQDITYSPCRNFLVHGFFFIKNKSSFIVGSFFQIDPIAVCEIEQSLEILEFPFFAELFHVVQKRAGNRSAAPVDTEVLEIILPVFFAGNMCHILYKQSHWMI